MTILIWNHNKSKVEAKNLIKAELTKMGYQNQVTWNDFNASASVGLGVVLSISGKVTDNSIVLDKCKGAASGIVLSECKKILQRIFPKN